uniref:Methionine aminopeptidase n=1 Tax=Cacopsylla melanoneura TaxID=428564 RepID=A0A8D8QYZ3_9HEMI
MAFMHDLVSFPTYFFNNFFKNFFYNILSFIKLNSNYSFINNNIIKNKKFFINEDYCSHGIFKNLHNNLIIFHCFKNNYLKIKNFDSFTIEPMFVFKDKNGYNYKNIFFSKKENFSFQWEHTMFILQCKILITTIRKNELCFI